MPNIFLLYIPPGNTQAVVHYEDTLKKRVSLDRIARFVAPEFRARLSSIFGHSPIAVWGSEAGKGNRSKFGRMVPGDDILIVEGDTIKLIGKIAAKVESEPLSRELWKPLTGKGNVDWRLIYFIANSRELNLKFAEFNRLFGYNLGYRLRGFTTVASGRLETFYSQYDDLYSVLVRLQEGKPVAQKAAAPLLMAPPPAPDLIELTPDHVDEVLQANIPSDHVRMQWKLARLGLKAGERVWVPVGDQTRLRNAYDFNEFDAEFTAGIDLPHSYVENIDVVWKQEFRIGAAYEIENSTSIYSGLLRFADLNILAPNTLYPMFVVAPQDRKNKLREQLRRPTFKQLELDKKVKFLSYEKVDEIDEFFSSSTSGLSVDLITGQAEFVT